MNHLLRDLAPLTETGWRFVDQEARERLQPGLAARRLVDFAGPHGWEHSATNLGRTERLEGVGGEGLDLRRRRVLSLVELRVPFRVDREELAAGDRGAPDIELADLDRAAEVLVTAENAAVFHGWAEAGVQGIIAGSPHQPVGTAGGEGYAGAVTRAVELLLRHGIGGPYALALGREEYTAVVESTEHGGYPLMDHLRQILGGPLVWAPGVRGAAVASLRGGDFLFDCGQDIAVGYDSHDAAGVAMYLEESFSFQVATPEAAVALAPLA